MPEEKKVDDIPESLIKYFESNDVNLSIIKLIDKIPRFVRTKQTNPIPLKELEQEIISTYNLETDKSIGLICSTPLNDFYELKSNIKIAYLNSYKQGRFYGMDISSGICCRILNPQSKENILDLCCAPGTKLIYIAQLMNNIGSVTGVDISESRLNVAKKLIRDHRITNVRIFCCDGTIFNEKPDISMGFKTNEIHSSCWNKKMIKKKRRKLRKQERKRNKNNLNINQEEKESLEFVLKHKNINGNKLYDKVLVDAQCTHDGSITHLRKYRDEWGWDKLMENVLNQENVVQTIQLQKKLIVNGFNLLNNNGILVYSTCSLSSEQNENIILYLLKLFENATLVCVENDESLKGFKFVQGKLLDLKYKNTRFDTTKCIRFDPFISKTSGLFIAKVLKCGKDTIAL